MAMIAVAFGKSRTAPAPAVAYLSAPAHSFDVRCCASDLRQDGLGDRRSIADHDDAIRR